MEVGSIEGVDGALGGLFVGELAEGEALWATSVTVAHQTNVHDVAGLREELPQLIFGRLVRQVANEEGVSRSAS